MTKIIFEIIFPLVLLGVLVIIIIIGISKKYPKQEFMSLDEFIRDWLNDHGQAHKLEKQFAQMKKDPSGKIYMPLTYHGAKLFIRWGLTPNLVSFMNLTLSFLIFYGVIMASKGHTLDLFSEQPAYGSLFFGLAALVVFTGIVDGIDGAIARLLNIKSKRGAWLDNVIDRVSDTLMLVCLVPTNLVVLSNGFNFSWMVWTNILLIFIYEYMRARHEGLGLLETKPFIGERITRILLISTFLALYGSSSLTVLLTYLINPDATDIWSASHEWIVDWTMLVYQISLLAIMTLSVILFARYIWKNLKKLDKNMRE